jgi:hypothetical protein
LTMRFSLFHTTIFILLPAFAAGIIPRSTTPRVLQAPSGRKLIRGLRFRQADDGCATVCPDPSFCCGKSQNAVSMNA